MRDIHSDLKAVNILGPVALAADNTPSALDLRGYDAAEILLNIGVGGITFDSTNKIEFKLTHSDDDVTYSAVTDADMLGVSGIANGIIKALVAAHAAAASYRYGYKGGKRYLKLLADFSGTHGTATPLCAVLLLGNGHNQPEANAA